MEAFIPELLLLITYEQLTQMLEIFDVVKTILNVAISTLVFKF